jgi:hypothetical protein
MRKNTTSRKRAITQTYAEQTKEIDRRIDKSEEGGVLDFTLSGKRLEIEARAAHDLLHVGAPDFIILALTKLISDAAKSKGLPEPTFTDDEDETQEQAIEKIAEIFCLAREYKQPIEDPRSNASLAHHLAAVFAHPKTPVVLYNAMREHLDVSFEGIIDGVETASPWITLMLDSLDEKEAEGGAR